MTNYQINLNNSRVAIIRNLINNYEGKNNEIVPWYKKTSSTFKKRFGFDIIGAPVIFKANDMIYKLSFIQSNYPSHLGGRKYEVVDYLPIITVGKYFDRLCLNNS